MRVRVRLFAGTRDAVGVGSLDVDVPERASVGDVLARVEVEHPRLARYRGVALLALDGAIVPSTAIVRAGATVAIMPPVSGGSGRLQTGPLHTPSIRLNTAGAGAVVTFLGLVRAPAKRLRFEAYDEMAEAALADVRAEAIAKFDLVDAEIRHRVADLAVGEPIVAVLVAARHRREAFEAAAWIMDELKTRVPIWKQEVDAAGELTWVNDPTIEGPGRGLGQGPGGQGTE